jgi:hypothetical protein
MISIKDMVKNNKKVYFQYYRTGELWYKTEDGFEFPVPIHDTGDASFLAEDKAILFMRYIRKQMDKIWQAKEDQAKYTYDETSNSN